MSAENMTQGMTGEKVSVLMNCLNGEKYLRQALDSVCAQTYKNWEIIFWDNVSTDKSADIVREYQNIHGSDKIKYFKGEKTIPLYAARNKALQQATGEYIGFLDVDDIWFPEKLAKQVPLFKNAKVGLVFSDTLFFDDNGYESRYYSQKQYCTGHCFKQLFHDYFLSLETVLMRKSCLQKMTHAFDDRFDMIGEADLFRRIALYYDLDMVPEVLAKWRIHPQSLSHTKAEKFAFETELVVEEYKKIIPGFATEYKSEMDELYRQAAIGKAKYYLRTGEPKAAKKSLNLAIANKKIWVLYFLSLWPAVVTKPLAKKYL